MEKIEKFLKDLAVALQVARIYTVTHPNFSAALEKTYVSLSDILSFKEELVIGFVGEELAFEKEIFFDLSKQIKPFIISFKERNIERINFRRGLQREELIKLISYFLIPKEEIAKTAQDYFLISGIKNISVGKIGIVPEDTVNAKLSSDYIAQYKDSLGRIEQPFNDVLEGKSLDYLGLRFTMANIMQNLTGKYQEFIKLTAIKKHDTSTFQHLLNVSILAIHFSSKLGFSKDDCLDIGTAALFHDIGKLQISREIIQKPDKLTDKEFLAMKSHTVLGTETLLKYVDILGVLPAVVAFEHHLRFDKQGYPKVTFSQSPHTVSLVVSICDVYDALTQRRTYKRDYPPIVIYDLMLREREKLFEPRLLDKFFKIMGVWPTGTIVLLNNGLVGIVRQVNEDDIYSPVVEIVSSQNKGTFLDLKNTKDTVKIEHSLNPLAEGKDYLSFV